MAKTTVNPEKLTEDAAKKAGIAGYDSSESYTNITKDVAHGMHYNWHNNIVPDNVVNKIAKAETVEKGLIDAADATLENWMAYDCSNDIEISPEKLDVWFIGVLRELAYRDGKGAIGENFARSLDKVGKIKEDKVGDENKGIDFRAETGTYQVKTGEKFKSSWEKKEADHLIWVKVKNQEIVGYEIDP